MRAVVRIRWLCLKLRCAGRLVFGREENQSTARNRMVMNVLYCFLPDLEGICCRSVGVFVTVDEPSRMRISQVAAIPIRAKGSE